MPFVLAFSLLVGVVSHSQIAQAASVAGAGERLITIHDRGSEKSLITKHNTMREVFAEAGVAIDPNDIVEPGLDEELAGNNYQVNVYRARPITVVDGTSSVRIMSAHQTPKLIAQAAGLSLHDEDDTAMTASDNPVHEGPGLRLVIDRATPVNLVLYGKKEKVYTQAGTVGEFLREKGITLAKKDTLAVKASRKITPNMKIEIWRNGEQTQTREEKIAFPVRQIQDTDRPVGYKKVTKAGVDGKKAVTYKVFIKNGKVVKRKAIRTVVLQKAVQQVEIVGAKPSFGGDFAAALAKLRSCEGGYNSWNPAGPYYGAYQFDRGTWASVADPAKYGKASPAEQDQAARKLYERRGWSPWPHCGASLPDTYR